MITDPVKITDTELLRRYAAAADEAAFTELVQRNLPVVYNAALRRLNGNTHLAEEAAQIVFTQLACKARSLARHPAFLGWLFTSTRFAASAIQRREVRRLNHEHSAAAMPPDNAASPDWAALRPLLDDALEELNEADRHAVVLRFFAGRSHAEIGAELQISAEAARKRVDRAVERLRDVLARRGVTTTAAALAPAMAAMPVVAAPAALAGEIAATAMTAASAAAAGGTLTTAVTGSVSAAQVSPTLIAAVSLVAALAIGTGIGTWSHQEQRARELDALHAEAVATRTRLADLRRRATLPTRADVSPPTVAPVVPADPLQARLIENLRAWEKIANDPIYAKVREQEFRMRAQREFGAFIAARGFPPQKTEFLRRALVAYYDAAERAQMDFQLAGINAVVDGKELGPRLARVQDALFAGLASEFAGQDLADIRRCFDAQRQMSDVRSTSRQLAFDGTPLTRQQELSLAMVLADADAAQASASPEAKRQMNAPDQSGLSARDRAQLADAAVFLNPGQLRQYEDYLRQENARSAIQARIREQVAAGAVTP